MPVLSTPSNPSSGSGFTKVVNDIVNAAHQDVQKLIGIANTLWVDYANRVSLQMLRMSNWKFLLSAPQRFVTQQGVTDYWIGATGANTSGTFDTGLNVTDLQRISPGSVKDRSNFKSLYKTDEAPLNSQLAYADDTSRLGRPDMWRNATESPNVVNIYPAPDNQNTYQPQPDGAVASTSVAGALAARIYYIKVTLVDSLGHESSASFTATKYYIPTNSVLVVVAPPEPAVAGSTGIKYDRYNVYASTVQGSESLQNVSPIAVGTNWTEPTSGLTSNGALAPTKNNLEPVDGYIIEFRYFKQRLQLTQLTDAIQIPDDYFDVVVAGVNALAYKYLKQYSDASVWEKEFAFGLQSMIRDKNMFPRGPEYIGPDRAAALGTSLPSVDFPDRDVRSN